MSPRHPVRAMWAPAWLLVALSLCGGLLAAPAAQAATIVVQDNDGANEGLNDPTAYTPQGGNNATTVGQARLNVLKQAAAIWGAVVKSGVDIQVGAKFDALTCTANSGTLGSAGPTLLLFNGYYYPAALVSAQQGTDQLAGSGYQDIDATFNSNVGQSGCLGGKPFYYGLDHNSGTAIDLLEVVTHEFGHGLGFISGVNANTGAPLDTQNNALTIFDTQLYDEATQQTWNKDTDAQRASAVVSGNGLTWGGASAVKAAAGYLSAGRNGAGRILMYAPATPVLYSSISHWDTSATPNLLLEPYYSNTIKTLDLTPCALMDIGWSLLTQGCLNTANHPPVATNQSVTTNANQPVAVTLAATDADNNALTYTVATQPAHGTLSGTAPNLTYRPAAGYTGADSFTFTASDGQATSNTGTVSITVAAVNHPPVAADQSVTTNANTAKAITLTATDADNDTLTYVVLTQPAHGTLSGNAPNLTYAPAANYSGPDSFTFQAKDAQSSSNTATVSITVNPPPATNSPPVASNQSVATTKGKTVAVTLSATDANNDPLTYAVATPPAHGTLSGTAPNLSYMPTVGYTGPDSFTFTASDGQATSNTATVSLTISNQPPIAAGQSVTDTVGQAVPIVLSGSDPDGDPITYTVLTQPQLGTLTGTAPNLTYTATAAGADSFTFQVIDNSGATSAVQTVSITNTAPGGSPTPTPTLQPTSGGGGGGAVPPAMLLALASLGLGRRRRRPRG